MRRKERNSIIKWACTLTDEELEKEYYDAVLDSLGSQTERMYDLGYDISDIRDREDYEKFLREKSDLLESVCKERGIELWKQPF